MKKTEDKAAPVITVDGPSASGKGTIARLVANKLSFAYLDSGAIYRVLAYAVIANGLSESDESAIVQLAKHLDLSFCDGCIFLGQEDISDAIRMLDVSILASRIAAIHSVREVLLIRQRAFRQQPGLVADGRDMGTVVFKDARLKIFLVASSEIRAKRRVAQLSLQGIDVSYDAALADIDERDYRDKNRKDSPLVCAEDAICLDSTCQSIEECVSFVLEKWQENQ